MKPSSMSKEISTVQRQKDMYILIREIKLHDEGYSWHNDFSGIRELSADGGSVRRTPYKILL
jgi:hypothetical protein